MRQSQLFTKTRREAPADETAKNAQLLVRGGFIHKEMAGAYDFLPLGLLVLKKIENIIREEMNAIGGQEILMTSLQDPEIWKATNRWDIEKVDTWFKTKLQNNTELGLAFTHEEPITRIMVNQIRSYKDLPFSAYQFQTKFRNESRAKSGILRVREFIMKDLYSFDKDEEGLNDFYEKASDAYIKIFNRVGLGDKTYKTFASGVFSKYSHEFQTLCETGEDIIFVNENKKFAVNKEVFTDEVLVDLGVSKNEFVEKKAIEVGNIFKLGARFSEALGLFYISENGEKLPVVMGSYGIGPCRVMGTIVELFADEKGIVWPESVAPFKLHLIEITSDKPEVKEMTEKIYKEIGESNVLYDDRDLRAGEKFADADLLGMPYQIIVSEKNIAQGKLELKTRKTGETKMVSEAEIFCL